MNEDIAIETFLLAIKKYRPGKNGAGVKAGEALCLWGVRFWGSVVLVGLTY